MESQPQNPDFRNNPENFHICYQEFSLYYKIVKAHTSLVHFQF